MTSIKMTMFLTLPDSMAQEFIKGTPKQRHHDLTYILERDYDISFSEPEVYKYENNGTTDGAISAGPYTGLRTGQELRSGNRQS